LFVKTVRAGPGFVRGQLDQHAAAPPGLADRPAEHGLAEPAAVILVHPDRLDLGPERTPAGQAGQEGQLHGGDHAALRLRHDQDVRRIAVDRGKGPPVRFQVRSPGAGRPRTSRYPAWPAHPQGQCA
jgi:hypothetical protein